MSCAEGAPCSTWNFSLVFDLLKFLAHNAGRVLSRDEIVEAVWQGRAVGATILELHQVGASRARRQRREPSTIRTVRGRGFEFTVPSRASMEIEQRPASPRRAMAHGTSRRKPWSRCRRREW